MAQAKKKSADTMFVTILRIRNQGYVAPNVFLTPVNHEPDGERPKKAVKVEAGEVVEAYADEVQGLMGEGILRQATAEEVSTQEVEEESGSVEGEEGKSGDPLA